MKSGNKASGQLWSCIHPVSHMTRMHMYLFINTHCTYVHVVYDFTDSASTPAGMNFFSSVMACSIPSASLECFTRYRGRIHLSPHTHTHTHLEVRRWYLPSPHRQWWQSLSWRTCWTPCTSPDKLSTTHSTTYTQTRQKKTCVTKLEANREMYVHLYQSDLSLVLACWGVGKCSTYIHLKYDITMTSYKKSHHTDKNILIMEKFSDLPGPYPKGVEDLFILLAKNFPDLWYTTYWYPDLIPEKLRAR